MIIWKVDFNREPLERFPYVCNVACIFVFAIIFYVLTISGLGWLLYWQALQTPDYGSLLMPVSLLALVSIVSVYLAFIVLNVCTLRIDALGWPRMWLLALALPVIGLFMLILLALVPDSAKPKQD